MREGSKERKELVTKNQRSKNENKLGSGAGESLEKGSPKSKRGDCASRDSQKPEKKAKNHSLPLPLGHISRKPISFVGWWEGLLAWLTGWC